MNHGQTSILLSRVGVSYYSKSQKSLLKFRVYEEDLEISCWKWLNTVFPLLTTSGKLIPFQGQERERMIDMEKSKTKKKKYKMELQQEALIVIGK